MPYAIPLPRIVSHLWDAFLLRDAERAALSRTERQQDDVVRFGRAARRLLRVADRLDEPDDAVAALVVYRQAAVLLAASIAKAKDAAAPPPRGAAEAWRLLQALPPSAAGRSSADLSGVGALLDNDDPMALDALAPAELRRLLDQVREDLAWVARQIDSRTPRAIRAIRFGRVAALALAALLACWFVGHALLSPKNLALNKPAFQSSHRPGSPEPGGVDNGQIEASYGVHTNVEDHPWVMIDLGSEHRIREVRVYNRGDGWFDEGLPLVIELSSDAKSWREAARRTEHYSQSAPWVAKTHWASARYVRVEVPRKGYIALSEIEVF